jgi:sugar-specific transcriptional regulator TrmB
MLFSDIFSRLGLSENEAKIYEMLLLRGQTKARDVLDDSGLSRGNLYNILASLTARGLIQVIEGKQQLYSVTDPAKLSSLIEERKQNVARLDAEFKETLPRLLSTYNITIGKPTIRCLEGIEGFAQALEETLQGGEILTYVDANAVVDEIAEVGARYLKQRIKKQVTKRVVIADTPRSREYVGSKPIPFTTTAFIPSFPDQFSISVQIYGDNVLFLSMDKSVILSVIVNDKRIADFHRQLFEYHWRSANDIVLPAE